jgi:SAM-dependent methyltransferase
VTDGPNTSGQNTSGGGGDGQVWLTGQRSLHAQRQGRFVADSIAHPARMFPDLAAHIIARFSRPGEWVLDPMCGIGTTVVQAVRAGRCAVGVEYEPRWLRIARENCDLARADGHHSDAHLVCGDARQLRQVLPAEVAGQVSLVLTSPPYGPGVHGHLTNRDARDPIAKRHHRYAPTRSDRANLAHTTQRHLASGMTAILTEAAAVLRPGGHVVMVVRPWRHRGVLVDLPEQMMTCAQDAGLVVTDRAAALLGRVDESTGTLVARSSFFQRLNVTRSRATGDPTHLVAHEDVIVASLARPQDANADDGTAGDGTAADATAENTSAQDTP